MRHFVFDAYGTLFDVHSAAQRYRDVIGSNADRLSQIWRTKHLEYTWVWALTGRHTTFRRLAEQSLDYAIATVGGIPPGIREKLLASYETLSPFAEVPQVLAELRSRGAYVSILTNGDPDLIDAAVSSSKLGGVIDTIITVHDANVFKPDARVYRRITDRFGIAPSEVSFQSSNRWDIAGAKVFGFHCVWINRIGAPDEYPETPPDHVVGDLTPLVAMVS